MEGSEPQVSLYLYGDKLEPEDVSTTLGHLPTKAWRKGEAKPSKRPHGGSIAATGLWMLRSESPSSDLSDHVAWLLACLSDWSGTSIAELPGVEVAKIDVYSQVSGMNARSIEVSADILRSLGIMGIGLEFTVDCFPQ